MPEGGRVLEVVQAEDVMGSTLPLVSMVFVV
jgi:hypothetical protein